MKEFFCGIDLGGTKIDIGIVTREGKVIHNIKIPTEVENGPENAIKRMKETINVLLNKLDLSIEDLGGIGIGSPGPLDTKEGVILKTSNLTGWENTRIVDMLKEDFKNIPIRLENDANAATIGEYLFGSGKNHKDFVYITVSTGVGGGAIVNGHFQSGANSNAFEIGHTILNFNGPKCNCGNYGCIEAYASGTALERFAKEAIDSGEESLIKELAGEGKIKGEHIVGAAKEKDPLALKLIEDEGYYLGLSLYNVIANYNPEVIAIGGGLSNALNMFYDKMMETIKGMSLKANIEACQIKKAERSDCGLVGAAALSFYEY
ncbi:ROK family protein [Anaeromicrobium sediminis]|uniref:Transcriptional regulator n=1 Tax=Anaeromicrobium sediminis TaxID=1478221 RepID=A0A267MIW1_9FIRM|nr:ROK family protein [Anaeromicrobium sediminis]PAB59521.1 transcriptional regulator [Anaeromicrobium sediminis]